jgi:hypothetical protein
MRAHAWHASALVLLGCVGVAQSAPVPVASNVQQPVLEWRGGVHSDWINVKANDIVGGLAKGDGTTDDSAALEAIMLNISGGRSRMVVYFPPGVYPISKTLAANGTIGAAFLGHGSQTTIKWVGAKNGTMFISAGCTKHRYAGLHWDGNGIAGIGVLHQSLNEFETEITHEAEAYSNFLEVCIAVISNPKHAIASAEILYRNTIFEDSKVGVLLNNFNDYDDTFGAPPHSFPSHSFTHTRARAHTHTFYPRTHTRAPAE